MPAGLVCGGSHDSNYLRTAAGMFPDLLEEIPSGGIRAVHRQWRSVWVDVIPAEQTPAGVHRITVSVRDRDRALIWEAPLSLRISEARLLPQKFIHTEWFHADCLADYYGVEVFSEEHWRLMENFIRYAAGHGINMILTPLFTPPLDTAVGGERTTVQLVDVSKDRDGYRFGFSKLDRWVEMIRGSGIEYLEIAHMFTQWGADHTPKILASVNGVVQQIFGVQAYLFKLQGLLHWGYNFYNSRYSRRHLDPYAVTDCDGSFPAGDAFLVYPGKDGHPRGSIRLAVLEQAMNDIRAP